MMLSKLDPKKIANASTKRKKASLNELAAKRLLAYASVAGAGLACMPRAQAEVVYTPVYRDIELRYAVDLNNDGIVDFRIYSFELSSFSSLSVKPAVKGNRIARSHSGNCAPRNGAAALPAGAVIGPTGSLSRAATCMFAGFSGNYGPWVDVQDHYLGLAFVIDGKTHFGWARMSTNPNYCLGCKARIEGYAYETEPGKAIIAGDEGGSAQSTMTPGSLGVLALGAQGVEFAEQKGTP